jgi:NTE family protein
VSPAAALGPRDGLVLALGCGGARGLAHVGVLEVLEEHGIRVRAIAGASIGAEMGAFYAHGVPIAEMVRRCENLDRQQTFRLFLPDLPTGGLASGRLMDSFFHELLGDVSFGELRIPFVAVATDLDSGDEVILDRGSVVDAVRASVSLPGVLAPRMLEGRILIDGGAANPLPADVARRTFGGPVVAVAVHAAAARLRRRLADLQPQGGGWRAGARALLGQAWVRETNAIRSYLEDQLAKHPEQEGLTMPTARVVFQRAQDIAEDAVVRARLATSPPDLLLVPDLSEFGTLEFHRGKEIVEAGRCAARAALQRLENLARNAEER